MAVKHLDLPPFGSVVLQKRRGTRSIRLSIANDGKIRVTLPKWAPYRLGIDFVRAKHEWIMAHHRQQPEPLKAGSLIGRSHRLVYQLGAGKIATRISNDEVRIRYPAHLKLSDDSVRTAVERACLRALKKQADVFLQTRLSELAVEHNFSYKSVTCKRLKTRWGSCDNRGHITLNIFLMQLPQEFIDYVLLHELVHTRVLRHGSPFWDAMTQVLPQAKELRQAMRHHQPQLQAVDRLNDLD